MPRHYFEIRKGRIEIIPMIDVMFFLLVFFVMIALQMIPDRGLALQLPRSSRTRRLPHPHYIVNIEKSGRVSIKGRAYDLKGLERLLRRDGDPAKTQITIAAERNVPFQDFVHVMDTCQKVGVSNIGIAAKPSR
jgi:biopolymer transport protein ExbD